LMTFIWGSMITVSSSVIFCIMLLKRTSLIGRLRISHEYC
jgi:hypothetical protein